METSQADGGTRSGLLWEVERILTECENKPQILLMENVPQVHSEKDMPHFRKWLQRLEELGYTNYWEDLNGKNYGIPQNRERTFMVSILRDKNGTEFNYRFPVGFSRKYVLKDLLEDNVDEKYYLSKKMIDYLTGVNQKESKYDRGSVFERNLNPNKDCAATITTAAGQRATDNFVIENETELKRGYSVSVKEECKNPVDGVDIIGNYSKSNFSQTPIIGKNGIAPTFTENHGQVAAIAIREATVQGYKEAHEGDGINISSRMKHQRGNVQEGMAQTLKTTCEVGVIVSNNESLITETEAKLFTEDGNIRRYIGSEQIDKFEDGDMATTTFPNGYGHGPRTHKGESITLNTIDRPVVKQNLRIRKLTPKEAGRLMGFQDIDTDRMYEIGLTDSAIFHVYGDSIITTCLIAIFAKLFGLNNKQIENVINDYVERIKE